MKGMLQVTNICSFTIHAADGRERLDGGERKDRLLEMAGDRPHYCPFVPEEITFVISLGSLHNPQGENLFVYGSKLAEAPA
jgi:hypothetical protein